MDIFTIFGLGLYLAIGIGFICGLLAPWAIKDLSLKWRIAISVGTALSLAMIWLAASH
jgi:uncharacterized membrane protein (Fun14 family)